MDVFDIDKSNIGSPVGGYISLFGVEKHGIVLKKPFFLDVIH
jgi:hypothetical protein